MKLADDVVTHRLEMTRGSLAIPAGPGLGAALDPEKLSRYATAGTSDAGPRSARSG